MKQHNHFMNFDNGAIRKNLEQVAEIFQIPEQLQLSFFAVWQQRITDLEISSNVLQDWIELARHLAPVRHFPEANLTSPMTAIAISLPTVSPKLYQDRSEGQSIIDYLQDPDGWGPYIEARVLTRRDLRRLDPKAEIALSNWLRDNKLPDDLYLPTKKQQNDEIIQSLTIPIGDEMRIARMLESRHRRGTPSPR